MADIKNPVFEENKHPADKYEPRYAIELFRWIMDGGTFESFECGPLDANEPRITRTTKQNWLKRIPAFESARHLAEDRVQANLDRLLYRRALGYKNKPAKESDLIDPELVSEKSLFFLLSRRFKKTYSTHNEVSVSNPDGSAIGSGVDLSKLSDEQLEKWIELQEALK